MKTDEMNGQADVFFFPFSFCSLLVEFWSALGAKSVLLYDLDTWMIIKTKSNFSL